MGDLICSVCPTAFHSTLLSCASCLSLPTQWCCLRALEHWQTVVWRAQPCTLPPLWAGLRFREDVSQAAGKLRWQGPGVRRDQRWDHRASSQAKLWSPSRSPRNVGPSLAVRWAWCCYKYHGQSLSDIMVSRSQLKSHVVSNCPWLYILKWPLVSVICDTQGMFMGVCDEQQCSRWFTMTALVTFKHFSPDVTLFLLEGVLPL